MRNTHAHSRTLQRYATRLDYKDASDRLKKGYCVRVVSIEKRPDENEVAYAIINNKGTQMLVVYKLNNFFVITALPHRIMKEVLNGTSKRYRMA